MSTKLFFMSALKYKEFSASTGEGERGGCTLSELMEGLGDIDALKEEICMVLFSTGVKGENFSLLRRDAIIFCFFDFFGMQIF